MTIKILYVEDNLYNLRLLRKMLMAQGCVPIEAFDGAHALLLADRERPDLIIMDIHLPNMNGFEALERLQSEPSLRAIPVIAFTADTSIRERCLAHGFVDVLTKPITMDGLRELLDRFTPPPFP